MPSDIIKTGTRSVFVSRWLCLYVLIHCCVTAQALAPNREITRYGHSSWGTENGLPQNTVRAILQSRDGYIWLATDEGLVRFDGLRFTVFDKQSTSAMKSNNIQCLFEDSTSRLWIGTDSGLLKLKDQKFTPYSISDGLCHDNIASVLEDRTGNVWIGTAAGLNRIQGDLIVDCTKQGSPAESVGQMLESADGKLWVSTTAGLVAVNGDSTTVYTTANGLPANNVTVIRERRDGDLWFGTSAGLAMFSDGKFKVFSTKDGLPNNLIWSLYEDDDRGLWVGTDGGLCLFRDGSVKAYTIKDGLSDNSIWSIHHDRSGLLWLGTPGGLTRIKQDSIASYTTRNGLSNNVVLSLLEDREGNLWIGTEAGGLNVLRDANFTTYTTKDGLSSDMVWTVYQGSDGSIWMGTQGGGLNRFKAGRFSSFTMQDGLPSDTVRALWQDRSGALWIGTPNGLSRFDQGRFRNYTVQDGISSNAVSCIHEDSQGQLWIGTLGGLTRFKDGSFTVYTRRNGLSDDAVTVIKEDSLSNLWIGTRAGGLNKFKDGSFTVFTTSDGLSDNSIRSIYEDSDGILWIGTRKGGVNRFEDGRFIAFTAREGLFDDGVLQIVGSPDGYLWMSSAKGVFKVSRADFERFAAGASDRISSISYGTIDGMQSRECNGGQPAGWMGTDGVLWFPTKKGVSVVNPQQLKINSESPPVVIEQFLVDNESIEFNRTGDLPAKTSRLEFQYAGLSFVAPEKVKFRYKLEGFDKDWVDAGSGRVAIYTSIPPGEYKFRVLASNNDGVWNETGAAVQFYLRPYFYQTWWFYVALSAALLLAGIAVYRLRLRRMRAQFAMVLAERNRMARELHDTLAQGFVGIGLQLKAIERALEENSGKAKQHLDLARGMVKHSIAEARRTVWDLRSQALEGRDLVAVLSETTERISTEAGVRATVAVKGTAHSLPADVENNVLRLCQEALTNAAKHSRATEIIVELDFGNEVIKVVITDNGCGFDADLAPSARDGHFGVTGMRERVEQMGGSFIIQSRAGHGTQIEAIIPERTKR